MSSRRLLKAAEAIREVVATSILTDLRDPRIRDVTVLSVEVAPDMREAKVAVSVMGTDAQQQLSLRGLQNAAGFLQSRIADRIETRYTPKLRFVLDQGTKNVVAVSEILERIRREQSDAADGSLPETLESTERLESAERLESPEMLEEDAAPAESHEGNAQPRPNQVDET